MESHTMVFIVSLCFEVSNVTAAAAAAAAADAIATTITHKLGTRMRDELHQGRIPAPVFACVRANTIATISSS